MEYFGDFETWLHDIAEDKMFKVERLRKIWTPEELENKYIDQAEYEAVIDYGSLVEVVPLGGELNNAQDYLLGFKDNWVSTDITNKEFVSQIMSGSEIHYYKLSEITLTDSTEYWNAHVADS